MIVDLAFVKAIFVTDDYGELPILYIHPASKPSTHCQ
jgi:hypothetical protein